MEGGRFGPPYRAMLDGDCDCRKVLRNNRDVAVFAGSRSAQTAPGYPGRGVRGSVTNDSYLPIVNTTRKRAFPLAIWA
jgi:hypothetical protein